MSIRKRGKKFFVDVSFQKQRLTGTFNTREEALEKEAEFRVQLIGGGAGGQVGGKRGSWTLEHAAAYTLQHHWEGLASYKKQLQITATLKDFFGPRMRLDHLDLEAIDGFIDHLKGLGNSNATINRKLSSLSKILTIAFQRGKAGAKVSLPRLKENEGRIRWLTVGEEASFLATLEQWQFTEERDAFIVLIDTGLRPGELWNLKGEQIDTRHKLLTVWGTSSKNGKSRSVVMTKRVSNILVARKKQQPDRLFPTLDNHSFRRIFLKVRDHLGMDADVQLVPYALRHTCCSRLVQRGANFYHVKEWMGHTTIMTTQRYTHLAPKNMEGLALLLEQQEEAA